MKYKLLSGVVLVVSATVAIPGWAAEVASDGADHVGAGAVAADGSDNVGANKLAADGADKVGANRLAADGADHVGAARLAYSRSGIGSDRVASSLMGEGSYTDQFNDPINAQ